MEPTSNHIVEIESQVDYGPRSAQALDNAIMLNHQVQGCLRAAPEIRETQFSVGFEGFIQKSGSIEKLNVLSVNNGLRMCLNSALSPLNLGPGAAGVFKMRVNRAQNTGNKGKSLILDLSEGANSVKKWE